MINEFELATANWQPKHPASEAELAGLEAHMTRGTCLDPLILPGDIVYIDPNATPELGDLVSFRVSKRFADAQAETPEDATQCRPGDPWVKLLCRFGNTDFLMENRGRHVTTTFACCESPDGFPRLAPVRNVRRQGRLLYEPPPTCMAGEVGANAATETYLASNNIQQLVFSFAGSGHNPYGQLFVLNAPPYACTAIVTVMLQSQSASGTGTSTIEVCYDDTGVGGGPSGAWQYSGTSLPVTSSPQTYALQWQFSHTGLSRSVYAGISFANFGGTTSSLYFSYFTVQLEFIKR